jgi:tRNA(Ile)-lysidine synthase
VTTGDRRLLEIVLDAIRRAGMLRGGEAVLVAVSGGADSVALLDVFRALAPELRVTLQAVHVHHGLREQADAEAAFTRALCAELGIPLHLERVAVRGTPPWDGLEAEARRARYAAFREVARRVGAERVATAHTADDQAETVLMRLLEGAGPRGLAGIAPVRGVYIRPFLGARRADIEAHLRARGLAWVEDASNRDHRFLRNRIRHDVLPFLAETVEPGIVRHLARSAALVRTLVDDFERAAARELLRLGRRGAAGWVLSVADLAKLPGEAAAETVRQAARDLGHSGALRGHAQKALRGLLVPGAGRGALRSAGVTVERSGRWLRVGQGRLPALSAREFPVPGELPLPEVGLVLEARCFERAQGYGAPREAVRAAFDADLLPGRLHVRGRRRGDRFAPFGGPADRRLKSFLIDAGVPRWERDRVPLLEARGDIIWVAGLRRGQAALVGPGTRRILEVTVRSPLAGSGPGE